MWNHCASLFTKFIIFFIFKLSKNVKNDVKCSIVAPSFSAKKQIHPAAFLVILFNSYKYTISDTQTPTRVIF